MTQEIVNKALSYDTVDEDRLVIGWEVAVDGGGLYGVNQDRNAFGYINVIEEDSWGAGALEWQNGGWIVGKGADRANVSY